MSGFQFKQFYLAQNNCAMKVGTDGILLGAWADVSNCEHILDVGTGTGLIALMLRQRVSADKTAPPKTVTSKTFTPKISALEIDQDAFLQARDNIKNSPWPDIDLQLQDFNHFKPKEKYDLVVSNPPYFNKSLTSPCDKRTRARHTGSLNFSDLIGKFCEITHEDGRLALVLPFDALAEIERLASQFSLSISKLVKIYTKAGKPAKRILIELSKNAKERVECALIIHDKNQSVAGYSQAYIALTKAFYLKM